MTPWIILLVLFGLRCVYLMYQVFTLRRPQATSRNGDQSVKTMIVIGSGGHTAEMLKITQFLDIRKYRPRLYVLASTDITSELKVVSVEYNNQTGDYVIVRVPRSRAVGQSYFTSVFTTLYAILATVPKMLYHRPELILCNGPGTCIPVCLIAFLMRALFLSDNRIVFFESICRVSSLSLSGMILMFFADNIFVQWPELKKKYWRTQYIGNL
ncbi:UDP-N-acetylglucosamine transferase subunit ALG14 homolog [Cimex lectularius]|uniref:UDP-N-acetylglucosamine transferase subunit ALG14 n=1 Tax=Cimex lectularius TaxID=79782 RepID=A0A8I6TFD4_CIMLE|nr:UDP-N-acetylglucosamine transferase subunit ALG14 homolog [Cimex lectularius]